MQSNYICYATFLKNKRKYSIKFKLILRKQFSFSRKENTIRLFNNGAVIF